MLTLRPNARTCLASCLVGLLASCNGSSGGGSPAPAPALTVKTQLPAPGSTVAIDTAVTLVFAADPEPDPATLTAAALQVADGAGPLPGSHQYDATTRTWTWIPSRELPRGARLTASVADSVRSLEGGRLAAAVSWDFHVRAGVPASPVTLATGVVTSALGPPSLYVSTLDNGDAMVVAGSQSWDWTSSGVSAPLTVPGSAVHGFHLDAAGEAVVVTLNGGLGVGVPINSATRSFGSPWSASQTIFSSGGGHPLSAKLSVNAAGDRMLYVPIGFTSPTHSRHYVVWASGASPSAWQTSPSSLATFVSTVVLTELDGTGKVATLRRDGTFLIAERHDRAEGTMQVYTVAQGSVSPMGLMASDDGTLRAVWRDVGITRQSFAAPGSSFGVPTDVPVFLPNTTNWRVAPSGALLGWGGTQAVRSAASSAEWSETTLAAQPLAGAISPRGEAVFIYFRLPNELMLLRWRPGELIDPPLLIATVNGPFVAFRDGAITVDEVGRVTVAFVPNSPGDLIGVRIE